MLDDGRGAVVSAGGGGLTIFFVVIGAEFVNCQARPRPEGEGMAIFISTDFSRHDVTDFCGERQNNCGHGSHR